MPLGPSNLGNSVLGWRENMPDPMTGKGIVVLGGDDDEAEEAAQAKTQIITHPDGSIEVVEVQPDDGMAMFRGHFENLALKLDDPYLNTLGADLVEEVGDDEMSRSSWTAMRTKGVDLLYLKLEEPGGETSGGSIARVGSGAMMEACIRYQSNFIGEMLPVDGPCKVEDDAQEQDPLRGALADAFEKDMNYFLTNVDEDYYPERDRASFRQALDGCFFTKQFHCPLRRRPASDVIYATDAIVSNDATSVRGAGRFTHRTFMDQNTMKRMVLLGVYRDTPMLQVPNEQPDEMQAKIKATEGQAPAPISTRQEDQRHENYEIYTRRIIKGDEHPDGLARPYRITVEKESMAVLEIRRNWKEGDENYTPLTKIVMYPLIPGLGFYPYGFSHIIGNPTRTLTAIMRQLIDAGMFASFPGWLRAKMGSRQLTNQIRIMPGGSQEIETGGLPLSDVVMPLPYKDPSPTLVAFYQALEANTRQMTGAIDVPVGEGKADIPVGTMLALIEQNSKVISSIHKRNHRALGEELRNIKELFAENPQALWTFNKRPKREWNAEEEFEDLNLVPASDPNIPSHIHRLMQTQAVVMRADADVQGQIYDKKEVEKWALRNIGITKPDALLAKPPPPGAAPPMPPDPKELIAMTATAREAEQTRELQQEQVSANNKMKLKEMDIAAKERDHQNRLQVANIDLERERLAAAASVHEKHAEILSNAHEHHTDITTTKMETDASKKVAIEGTKQALEATKAAKHKAKPVEKSFDKKKAKPPE